MCFFSLSLIFLPFTLTLVGFFFLLGFVYVCTYVFRLYYCIARIDCQLLNLCSYDHLSSILLFALIELFLNA